MRLPRALARLTGSAPSTAVPAAPLASWRSDEAITAAALRGGAREHEIDAVLRAVRGDTPVPVPREVDGEVRGALEAVRSGGPTRFGIARYGMGIYSPTPGKTPVST